MRTDFSEEGGSRIGAPSGSPGGPIHILYGPAGRCALTLDFTTGSLAPIMDALLEPLANFPDSPRRAFHLP